MVIPLYCRRNRDVSIIVSEHRDGELVTASVYASGNRTVRGSTSRGGAKALARMIRLARNGEKICFTPDGPRGPRYGTSVRACVRCGENWCTCRADYRQCPMGVYLQELGYIPIAYTIFKGGSCYWAIRTM